MSPTTDPSAASDGTAAPAALTVEDVVTGLRVPRAVEIVESGAMLVSDQGGRIVVVEEGRTRPDPFLDLTGQILEPTSRQLELGLTGFALAPDFATTGTFYTFATEPPREADASSVRRVDVVARWTADPQTLVADPESKEVLIEQPRETVDHIGGEIAFDADGLMYASFGARSGNEEAQDPVTLAGSVIRIDPAGTASAIPYGIPEGNPFSGSDGAPEVWSYGYRNPWRLVWDDELGLLVGSALWRDKPQQVDAPGPGDNAGYPEVREACWVDGQIAEACRQTEAGVPIAPPVIESTFGTILSGVALPTAGPLAGRVVVAEWNGAIIAAEAGAEAPWPTTSFELPPDVVSGRYVWDLDVDAEGHLLLLTTSRQMSDGRVIRVS